MDPQTAHLLRAYSQARAARHRQMLLGAALFLVALVLALAGAEVNPAVFWAKLGNFTSYFTRLAYLDTGASVLSDPAEWFWGLRKWSLLLGDINQGEENAVTHNLIRILIKITPALIAK